MQDNKQLDLGGFTLYDSTPIEPFTTPAEAEENITNRVVANIYHIFQAAVDTKKQEIADI